MLHTPSPAKPTLRARFDRGAHTVIELCLGTLVCLAPWAFGAVEPFYEFLLYVGLAFLLLVWAARMLLSRRFNWKNDPVVLCLGALFLFGILQLAPLPRPALAWLAPHTAQMYDQMLPAEPEVLPLGETWQSPPASAGSAISLYPAATQRELIRILAVFLAYVVARNNCCSPFALRRLHVALVVNGCLLSLLAIIQFVSSPHDTVYWNIQTRGAVFGPFVCRTHFPAYVNVCIGSAIGLLLALGSAGAGKIGSLERPDGTIDRPASCTIRRACG